MNPQTTVLLVEDDERIRNYIKTILTSYNYSVMEINNARTALSMIASHNPDLLLLDLGLPDGDGMEVIRTVRGWSQIPIIAARSPSGDRAQSSLPIPQSRNLPPTRRIPKNKNPGGPQNNECLRF